MRSIRFAASLVAALAVSAGGMVVFAEDPPVAGPKPLTKIQSPLLDSLVGAWEFTGKAMGQEMKGVETWAKAVDGTAFVQELHVEMAGGTFDGLGVLRVADDGKTLSYWWFDSMGQGGVWKFTGTLLEDGFDLKSDEGGLKAEKRLRKKGDVVEYSEKHGEMAAVSATAKKATKTVEIPVPKECPLATHAFFKAQLGDWKIAGTSMGQAYEGKSRFRLAVGGHYVVQEYELHGGPEHHHAIGVTSIGADGKTLRSWWFGNFFKIEPLASTGTVTDTVASAKGPHPMGMEVAVTFTREGDGFAAVYKAGEMELLKETYTRVR